jgi:hypothetical protein
VRKGSHRIEKGSGEVKPKYPSGPLKPVRLTTEECRTQAQKCIDESRKTQSSRKLSAAWIALAEEWVVMAELASRIKHDESS